MLRFADPLGVPDPDPGDAGAKSCGQLYVIGFALQPDARRLIESREQSIGVPAVRVQAGSDRAMGDRLKNVRSSQIFAVCELPDVQIRRAGEGACQAALPGLDVFDPADVNSARREGNGISARIPDTDYNGLDFPVCQAFFPRTPAREGPQRSLRGEFDDSVWTHLSGTASTPLAAGEPEQAAVKAIDDRGHELMAVKPLPEAAV